jgi:hypothetical protein
VKRGIVMITIHRLPKIEINFPEPEVYLCQACGGEFHEWQMVQEPRVVPMCFGCSYPKRGMRMSGMSNIWFYEFDRGVCDTSRLLCRQVMQIAASVQRLEDECRISI